MAPPGHRSTRALVGRADELASFDALVAARDRRSAHFVVVSGEPGIGKTRLLAEFCARAGEAGRLVLEGTATEYEREVPFAVLVDALDDYLGSLHPRLLERLGVERLAELARALPSLAGYRQDDATLEAERYRLHRAVRALLELLGSQQPVVLALDDVHWVDGASLELLLHLVRHPPRADALLVVAFRPVQVDAQLSTQLAATSAGEDATLVSLGPLSEAEIAALLGNEPGDRRSCMLYRQSGGNPFFAEQLARVPGDERSRTEAGEVEEGVPAAVAAAIDRELSGLSDSARSLLEGGAVAGDPFDLDLAAASAGTDLTRSTRLLDELLHRDLVRATDVPTRFRFRHPIVRRSVYGASGHGWRLEAHARAAEELRRRGEPALQRAHHVERSALPGDEVAIALLREAADAATPRAPATAARWLEAALRLLPDGQSELRLDLLSALAGALVTTGRLEDAQRCLLEALELTPPEPVDRRITLLYLHANVERNLGRGADAYARLLAALDELPDDAVREAAQIEAHLAVNAAQGGPFYGPGKGGERARAAAEAANDPALLAAVIASLAAGDAFLGESETARRQVAEAAALIDALDDEQLAVGVSVGTSGIAPLGMAEWWLDAYADSLRHLERSVRLARACGQSANLTLLLGARGVVLAMLGRSAEGLDSAGEAVEAARLAVPNFVVRALYLLALAAVEAGDLGYAARAASEGLELGSTVPPTMFWTGCHGILAITRGVWVGHGHPGTGKSTSRRGEPPRVSDPQPRGCHDRLHSGPFRRAIFALVLVPHNLAERRESGRPRTVLVDRKLRRPAAEPHSPCRARQGRRVALRIAVDHQRRRRRAFGHLPPASLLQHVLECGRLLRRRGRQRVRRPDRGGGCLAFGSAGSRRYSAVLASGNPGRARLQRLAQHGSRRLRQVEQIADCGERSEGWLYVSRPGDADREDAHVQARAPAARR
jgi:tetratricopeptide (TPR) repeat protein